MKLKQTENSEINRKTWVKENVRETVSHPSTLLPPSVNVVDTYLYFTITYYFFRKVSHSLDSSIGINSRDKTATHLILKL